MEVNCAVHVMQISSTQKWKNRHLKQCMQDFNVARLRDGEIAGSRECKIARFQDCKVTRLQDCKGTTEI